MADEDKKDQENAEASDKKGGKGGMLKLILIPVILLVQAVAAYFIVFNLLLKNPNAKEETNEKKSRLEVGQFFELNDIVINPADTGGRRYLVLEMGLETKDPKVVEEAAGKEIWIRDAIISHLTKKTALELMEISIRKGLKKEILDILNEKLSEGRFDKVYFKKYILQ